MLTVERAVAGGHQPFQPAQGRRVGAVGARPGEIGGFFCLGYGVARIVGEFFREPDAHLGYLLGPITMGMVLSLPLVLIGGFFIWRARKRAAAKAAVAA